MMGRDASRPGAVAAPVPPRPAPSRAWAVGPFVVVVIGIIGVAFRGSWGALRDAALACHFDRSSADLYPFAVDGLLIVAILAAVLLRHDRGARQYTLAIIAGYTGASWLINFLHGLGQFALDPATNTRPVPAWPVVVVVASLVIGSIFLGSHLLVYVWRHLSPDVTPVREPDEAESPPAGPYQAVTEAGHDGTAAPEPPGTVLDAARAAYRHSLAPGRQKLSQRAMVDQFGLTKRQAGTVQSEVSRELANETAAAATPDPEDGTPVPSQNGRHPS